MNKTKPSSVQLPVQQKPEERTMKRQHTVRYYVHRVHESLTTRVSKLVCAIFLSLLFIVGLITFILYISLKPHRPRFHIQEFNLPEGSGLEGAKIGFSVTARNANLNIGIRYDAMEASLFYRDQKIGAAPGIIPAFYQEPKNTKLVQGGFSGATLTVSSEQWKAFMSDREKGTVIFRLEIVSTIQFKISSWESKRHHVHANCDVHVGPDGHILPAFKNLKCPVYFS